MCACAFGGEERCACSSFRVADGKWPFHSEKEEEEGIAKKAPGRKVTAAVAVSSSS